MSEINSEELQLNVKELTGDQYFITILSNALISDLKNAIFKLRDIPIIQQRIIFSGKELNDNIPLYKYNLTNGRTVHLVKRKQLINNNNYGSISNNIQTNNTTIINIDNEQQPLNNENDNEGIIL